jgi:micrococcal nuclease
MILKMKKLKYYLFSIILITFAGCGATGQIPEEKSIPTTPELEKVIDGDTFTIKTGEKIRVASIDTPEMYGENNIREAYSMQAYYRTKELLENNSFELRKLSQRDKDPYNRLLRNVYIINENKYLSEILVKEGLARVYYDTSLPLNHLLELCSFEKQAQKFQKNIWEAKSRGYFERKSPKCP